MFFLPPAQVKPVQAPLPMEVATLDFCRDVAARMGSGEMEFKVDPKRLEAMRKQALQMLQASKLPQNGTAAPLLEASLGSLEAAMGLDAQIPETRGSFRYGRAAKVLAMRYQINLLRVGAGDPELLPDLEALALLYRIAGLRDFHWRDEALRIRVKRPDARLEKDLAATVEDHYGPWLTAVELEPMLEFCEHLAQLWLNSEDLNRKVLEVGLKPEATRVWRLAARKGSESLRGDLSVLLRRLNPAALSRASRTKGQEAFVQLGEALLQTPLEGEARSLLKRVDASSPSPPLKRKIARALEDWESEARLLEAALKEASPKDSVPLLRDAELLLREHPDEALLEQGTLNLKSAIQQGVPDLASSLGLWVRLLRDSDRRDDLDDCLRLWLAQTDSTPEACAFLARMGLWNELESRLMAFRNEQDPRCMFWRFQCASGLDHEAEAQRWSLAWTESLLFMEPKEVPSFPGASGALPLLRTEQLAKLAAHLGSSLVPGQESLLQQEPWRILVALDPDAPANLLPEKLEQALRWRMDRMPRGPGRAGALKKLLEEAETALGTSHPALAEVLLALAKEEDESERIPHLERAVSILEKEPEGRTAQLADLHATLAAARSLIGDRKGLERDGRRIIELLEGMPELKGESLPRIVESLPLLLLHHWREQSFDEPAALAPRILALVQRAQREGHSIKEDATEFAVILDSTNRLARLQNQLPDCLESESSVWCDPGRNKSSKKNREQRGR